MDKHRLTSINGATPGDRVSCWKPYHAWTGLVKTLALGALILKVLDSSPYDRTMRRFHNYMKDTPSFQQQQDGHEEFRFPPFSAWMVFTDMVSHACL